MTKFYAVTHGGQTFTRSTMNRAYTHAVVYQFDGMTRKAERDAAYAGERASQLAGLASYYDEQIAVSKCEPGAIHPTKPTKQSYVSGRGFVDVANVLSEFDVSYARERVAEYGTREQALAADARRMDEQKATSDAYDVANHGRWFLEGFCGRADLADKLAAKLRAGGEKYGRSLSAIAVVEAIEITDRAAARAAKQAEKAGRAS